MAYCPNCGSDHIQLKQETNVNWGRAIAGFALFGVVGGAVGAVTGADRTVNACLDCGTTWKAADLYKMLELIRSSTERELDLSLNKDRIYLNNFIIEMEPCFELQAKAEARIDKLKNDYEKNRNEKEGEQFMVGCLFYFFVIGILSIISFSILPAGIAVIAIAVFCVAWYKLIAYAYRTRPNTMDTEKAKLEEQVLKIRQEAEIKFQYKIKEFILKYSD